MLGAHLDSVAAGPGINDNGSGSITLLQIAFELARYQLTNAVRFTWWSAEEFGLLGSINYLTTLPEEELAKIALYIKYVRRRVLSKQSARTISDLFGVN